MNEMKRILLPGEPEKVEAELPRSEALLFAPVDKRAFGAAIGTAAAVAVTSITAVQIVFHPSPAMNLELLDQFFPGYDVSWAGAAAGALWAFASGFCMGWFTAFVRNFVLALSLFFLRSKAELSDSRDFLDHI